MKIQQTMHIMYRRDYMGEAEYKLHAYDMSGVGSLEYIRVGTHDVEFEVPDDFNPVQLEVEQLRRQKDKIREDSLKAMDAIEDKIAKLLCLTYVPAEEEV